MSSELLTISSQIWPNSRRRPAQSVPPGAALEDAVEATAIRKLIRAGLQTYVARQYRSGALTLRAAAPSLALDLVTTMDLLLDRRVKGSFLAADVLKSVEHFG